jgi:hypothetical protein
MLGSNVPWPVLVPPFQGLERLMMQMPRALPEAWMLCTFGAEDKGNKKALSSERAFFVRWEWRIRKRKLSVAREGFGLSGAGASAEAAELGADGGGCCPRGWDRRPSIAERSTTIPAERSAGRRIGILPV